MHEWKSSLIDEIFAQKQKEKSEDRDNLLRLISRSLYGEAIHYALELIQNAEDEDSSFISFIFDKNEALVVNDGRSFDEEDVWGICSVRTGRKRKKIGFFGIGFKAVFNVTKTPQIISNGFNFELHDFIYPKSLDLIPDTAGGYHKRDKGAIFVLPYSSDLTSPQSLIENFSLIDEKILLFLESIQTLEFADKINGKNWSIKTIPEGEAASLRTEDVHETKCLRVSLINTLTEQKPKWFVFHRDLPVTDTSIIPKGKEGIEKTRITIAFPLDNDTRDNIKKSGVVYCYLPTKKRTDLPFLIQADFLPTIGRENLDYIDGRLWNTWLMRELGTLAADAINNMRSDEELSRIIYDFIPLTEEVQDEAIKQLFNSLFEALKVKEIARVSENWVKPELCATPDDDRLRDVLSESDLKLLFPTGVFYIDPSLSEKEYFSRAENVLFELGARKIDLPEVIDFLQHEKEVLKKNEEWFLCVYDYLRTNFDTSKKSYKDDFPWAWEEPLKTLFKNLEISKFLLTDEGEVVPLKDPKAPDRLICYPQSIDLSIVHSLFTEGEIVFLNRHFQESSITHRKQDNPETEEKRKQVKEWFASIGVRKYLKQTHIIKDAILPKFTTGKYKQYDDVKLYSLLDYIRTYWSTIETEIESSKRSSDILNDIKASVLVKAYRYNGDEIVSDYKKPGEVYFSPKYGKNEVMEELFKDIGDVYFLPPYYLNREKKEIKKKKRGRQKVEYTWRKFFELLGVWSSPRVVKEKKWIPLSGEHKWVKKEYSPSGVQELYGNSFSEDIRKLIEYCSKLEDKDEVRKRMVILWESLEDNWKFYKDEGYCNTIYKWVYYQPQQKNYELSSFLEFLQDAGWVPGKDGSFHQPNELFAYTSKNVTLLGDDVKYVELKANDTFLKDLGARIEPTVEEVIGHLKRYRQGNPNPSSNQIQKMSVIYGFLQEKLNSIPDAGEKESWLKDAKKTIADAELLYLPREDKIWWKPADVFWRDYSEHFEKLRGYVEHKGIPIYGASLKDFLSLLGVSEKPSVSDCLDILQDLKASGDSRYKAFASRIFSVIESLIKQDTAPETDWNREVFLSENGKFLSPTNLYYCDDEELKAYFSSKIEILWLPFHWDNVKAMLSAGGFKRLSQSISIAKRFDSLKEIDGDQTSQLLQRLSYVNNYLSKKKYELFTDFQKSGVLKRVDEMEPFEAPEILLDYTLRTDGEAPVAVDDVEKDAYFSKEENRLYKSAQISLLSTPVAKELSKLFAPSEDEVFLLLDALFNANDEELDRKLEHFGIKDAPAFEKQPSEEVKIIAPEEKETAEGETKGGEEEPLQESDEKKRKPFIPPPAPPPTSGLIDPNDFIFDDDIEEHDPYTKTDGPPPEVSHRIVKLKKGQPGDKGDQHKAKYVAGRLDGHEIAIQIAMRLEEMEGKEAEYRHDQRSIGYDVYSHAEDGSEFFIEVKSLRGESGMWELTPHEWKKAEQEKERYFVYVVSRLKEGSTPIIEIVQNPVKYLTPDPPAKKFFSDWKNGVLKTVKTLKI